MALGADLGGGGRPPPPPPPLSGILPPADPKVPPLVVFWKKHFRLTRPKKLLKAFLARINIY